LSVSRTIVALISFAEWIDRHVGVSMEAPACLDPDSSHDDAAPAALRGSEERRGPRRTRTRERIRGWIVRACRRLAPPRLVKIK